MPSMAKNKVPRNPSWKLREKCRQLQSASEAESRAQTVEIEQLRAALRGAHDADKGQLPATPL